MQRTAMYMRKVSNKERNVPIGERRIVNGINNMHNRTSLLHNNVQADEEIHHFLGEELRKIFVVPLFAVKRERLGGLREASTASAKHAQTSL